jgi:hypothetical protein
VQHHALEPTYAITPYFHHSLGTIGIGCHDDPGFGGEVEIPELMASRQRRNEQLLRVPTRAVSPKGRVGGAVNDRLAIRADLIIPGIVAIPRGATPRLPFQVTDTEYRCSRVFAMTVNRIVLDCKLRTFPAVESSRIARFT